MDGIPGIYRPDDFPYPTKDKVTFRYFALYAKSPRVKVNRKSLGAVASRILEEELRLFPANG